MAEGESDLETDRLEVDLETLFDRYCSSKCALQSKEYCSEFCKLVEEHTGRWQVPLPQLKVLRTALCCFSKATAAFPDDCQHVCYAVSSLALSFFELMLFFGKEEFQEDPLRDILDSFQDCYSSLLRHSNVYLQQVKQVMKDGGPWESPVLQAILREAALPQAEVEEYVSSEVPVFFELRVRYLQACERVQEALALAKSCLEHPDTGKHLYFHQAYLTCLYKASLHEHLHKEMAEIDGRDAVEIICNTESVEKDELLLSLCKAFLTQQLHNGDMYYIWDLVFIWSRLHLRAYPSKQGFLAECRQLMSSATNIRAIFPFIKVVTAEMVSEGVQLCVELCAHALKSDPKADPLTRSLVYKTIAFLLPRDLEVCRACALLVFLLERSVEAYRTVCLLYTHPDEEPHPHHNLIRPNVRFYILQVLKEGLCFDPEFWNLLTLRTHCLELMSDKAMKAALSEMKDEETEEEEEWIPNDYMHEDCMPHTDTLKSHTNSALQTTKKTLEEKPKVEPEGREALPETTEDAPVRRRRKRRRRRRRHGSDDVDSADDPDIKFSVKPAHSDIKYTLRRKLTNPESMAKLPANRQREYLSRHVKNKIMKRRGRKPRWLLLEMARQAENTIPGGKRHALRTISMLELSYPENDIFMEQEEERIHTQHSIKEENGLENHVNMEPSSSLHGETHVEPPTEMDIKPLDCRSEKSTLVEATLEVEGPEVEECPLQLFHSYSKPPKGFYAKEPEPSESTRTELQEDSTEMEQIPSVDDTHTQGEGDRRVPEVLGKRYALLRYHCGYCQKDFKGGNVVRHSLSHLKGRRRRCIFCGKRFRQYDLAKQHVLEHIEELRTAAPNSKELGSTKTKKKKQRTATPNSEMAPAVNGSTEPLVKETQSSENLTQPSAPTPTDQPPKAKSRKAKPEVSQESRIIQNLRTLIKKTQSLHKKQTIDNHTNHEPELLKDEQVIVKDKLVIVREAPVKEGEGRENGVGMKYHLCPAEGCDKVFLRIGQTLIRHAVNNHIGDPAVLEQTFQWGKGKCVLCTRYLFNRQHYRDHMKFHDNPLKQMCVHLDCSHRFKTPQDLKEHMDTHKPLQPQCQFPGCEQIFSGLPMLYDHEWRHYTQPQPKDETEQIVPTQHSTDAPWKQRVKSQEVSLHGWKGYKETASPETKCLDPPKNSTPDPGERAVSEAVTEGSEGGQKPELDPSSKVSPVGTPDTHFSDPIPKLINGHEEDKRDKGPEKEVPVFTAIPSASPQLGAQNPPDLLCLNPAEPVDIKEVEGIVTLSEITQFMAEPSIPPPKTFKLEDPTYAPVAKAPFIRPPPSTYLDEQALCMPKRRKAFEATSSSSNSKNGVVAGGKQTLRQRCSKCFSSFSSPEELQKHLSLNTCSSLFSFDSDEDS